MKLKIKVKELTEGCLPQITEKGDWIDLKSAVDINIPAGVASYSYRKMKNGERKYYKYIQIPIEYIPLGIAVELPKGYEAIINSRSSGPKKMNMFIPNGQGVIDQSYCGDTDEWRYVASPLQEINIKKGDRICQFRIQLNQKATIWQKIKWLFTSGVEIVQVESLSNPNRGGFGSTGK